MKTYNIKLKYNETTPYKEEDGIESEEEAIECFKEHLKMLSKDDFAVKVFNVER